ncbi:hypothetical protein LXL04_012537 [Taraxacum kok-saghyz]
MLRAIEYALYTEGRGSRTRVEFDELVIIGSVGFMITKQQTINRIDDYSCELERRTVQSTLHGPLVEMSWLRGATVNTSPHNRGRFFRESRSFENSYIPENPRTPKPLTFSKNRLRGAKNRSNISPVAKNNFRKNDFFFSKNFAYVQKKILCICAQSLYNTYLKRFVKKKLKKNAKKKKFHICTKNKKKLHICKRFRSRFFERNNGLGDIGNWGSSRGGSNENNYWI